MSSTSPSPENNKNKKTENGPEDQFLDQTLRPTRFEQYIGQDSIKKNLGVLLTAAAERNHPPEHILFYGPPGLGKTTLAHLIAHETSRQLRATSGPAIEKVGDLASLLTNLSPGDILFIDEIHRLNKLVEEILYPAMESGAIDIIVGKGPSARSIQLSLPPFTLIAATTRMSLLSSPLRSRFSGGTFRLEFYTDEQITDIINQSAEKLGITLEKGAAEEIAKRSRKTPRTANYLLKRCRDYAQVKRGDLTKEVVREALRMLDIDDIGLTASDRLVLRTIVEKFDGGPVGLKTIAAATSEEEDTIEEVYEPYLLQLGLLDRTPRGRIATVRAYEHLGCDIPPSHPAAQNSLL